LVLPLTAPGPAGAAGRIPPDQDPFYSYSGNLAALPNGAVLKERSVALSLGTTAPTPVEAEQLLYRSTDQLGAPSATVTTVLVPGPLAAVPRIVDYLSFYDGLGPLCDPSYTLAGGDPGSSSFGQQAQEEELLIVWYLSQGDVVTVPDFEGTGSHWMAGRESGQASIDAVRATESFLGVGPGTPVGISGYSGGAMAADWASELAPAYAPELHLVGVAEAGVPVNYLDMFAYINGSPTYSVAIPGMLIGLARAYGLPLGQYLSPTGQSVVSQIQKACMASLFGSYTLTVDQIMAPGFADLAHTAPFASILSDQTMGNAGIPEEPLLMAVGNSDGTGDGAMVAADVRALARKFCAEGVPVQFQEYPGFSHEAAGAPFDPQTGPFLQSRFAGAPVASNCALLAS
jgi:hypothetical protein